MAFFKKEVKDQLVQTRVTSDLKGKIKDKVEQMNITVSEYITNLIEKDLFKA